MFTTIFIYDPLFTVIKKEGMTINSFKINVLLFFSFQDKICFDISGIALKLENSRFKYYCRDFKELTFS